jgi:hypothetical protein
MLSHNTSLHPGCRACSSSMNKDEVEQIWNLWNLWEHFQARRLQLECSDALYLACGQSTKTAMRSDSNQQED